MQEYLLVARSCGQLNVIHLRGGLLHPRWSVLSGLPTVLLSCLGYLFLYDVPYLSGTFSFLNFFYEAYRWPFFVQVLLIELLFLLGWVVMFVLGYIPIEAPGRPHSHLKGFLRSISDTGPLRWLFSVCGVFFLSGIIASIVKWLLHDVPIQPLPLALSIIVVLIAAWMQIHYILCRHCLIKEKELEPVINAIVSPFYLFSCLPFIDMVIHMVRKNQGQPGTMLIDMQSSHQINDDVDEIT